MTQPPDKRLLTEATAATQATNPATPLGAALNATYARAFEPSASIVYDGSGNVTSATEGGITTTFTYNADGTVNTETRQGRVRTWAYDANGNPTSSTVV
jgi:YD repeat-containing protein